MRSQSQAQSQYPSPDSGCSPPPQDPRSRRRRHGDQASQALSSAKPLRRPPSPMKGGPTGHPGRGQGRNRGRPVLKTTTPTTPTLNITPTPNRSPRQYHTSRHRTLIRKWMFQFRFLHTLVPSRLTSSPKTPKASQSSGSLGAKVRAKWRAFRRRQGTQDSRITEPNVMEQHWTSPP